MEPLGHMASVAPTDQVLKHSTIRQTEFGLYFGRLQDESPHILIADVAVCSKAFSWTNAWLEVSKHGALHYLTLITDHHCRSINYDPAVRETHFNREYCAITNSSTLLWTPGVLLMTDRDSSDWSNNLFLHSCFGMFWLWPSESQAPHIESWQHMIASEVVGVSWQAVLL